MSEALSAYYDAVIRDETMQSERNALRQVLDKMSAALERKQVSLRQDLANAEQAEDYRIKGELLTANFAPGRARTGGYPRYRTTTAQI